MAQDDGVDCIVATPHSLEFPPHYRRGDICQLVEQVVEEMEGQGLGIVLAPGVEAHISPDMVRELEEERIFTLNGSSYMLVELPLLFYPHYAEEVLFQLQVKRITPIIAHPERNRVIQEQPSILHRLVSRGMLAQVTAASLAGVFGQQVKELAMAFLEHNLAHIIASDAHTLTSRSPVLSQGVEVAGEAIGEERARAMVTTTPQSILAGEKVDPEEPREYRAKKRKWFGARLLGGRR
jgi:protein-tyrosine phosphatase